MMSECKLDQFLNKEYIRLETIKRNGQVVVTPVWFVVDDVTIFVDLMPTAARSNACETTLM